MFPETPELSVSIPAKTELLKMLVELTNHIAVRNFFPASESRKIALAVDEAITNVIKHSYKESSDAEIKLDFFCSNEGMKIKIEFSGIPPQLSDAMVNLEKMIKAKKKGGLGVALIKRIMDSVEYSTIKDTNYLEMIKWKKSS
ncbi:MAG: ATP-binding protein [Candidatus Aminicenantes bacterium]|nr:ATP-binding protein [Candidatus Aminicenantes bacterium]